MNCPDSVDSLQCLRGVPLETLNAVINGTNGESEYNVSPVIDGYSVREWGSIYLKEHLSVTHLGWLEYR